MDLTDKDAAPADTIQHLTILVDQSIAGVGSTVWDAEVILAHYLHSLPSKIIGNPPSLPPSLPFLNPCILFCSLMKAPAPCNDFLLLSALL